MITCASRRIFALAEEFPAEYVGAVEGHHLMAEGRADVIVVDGFTGNVALKSMEGALRWSVGAMGIAYGSIGPAREVLRSTHSAVRRIAPRGRRQHRGRTRSIACG